MSVDQNLVLTLTSLMEVILKLTLRFQPKDKHYKFSYAMMTLKQPIPLAPNVEFPIYKKLAPQIYFGFE